MMEILIPILAVTVIGLICAVGLAVASSVMAVKEDTRFTEIRACLPGANCGACGYTGCDGYAKALLEPGTKTNLCVPGADAVAAQIAALLGVEAEDVVEKIAVVQCAGTCEATSVKADYRGIPSCAAAKLFYGGNGSCIFGCMGFGDCARACPKNAISMQDGIACVNHAACIGCGICAQTCPQKIIEIVPDIIRTEVLCSSYHNGPYTKKVCSSGCIGCHKCEKTCPVDAITIDRRNRTWTIDRNKCITCGACVLDCPAKCLSLEDTWGEGENKAAVTTYQGKVLTRRPRVRPAPPAPKVEVPKAAPAPEPVKDVPQSENPYHVKNTIEKCLFCGRCEHSCPMQAITIDRKTRKWTIDREKCVACGVCAENCPAKCLAMKEEWEEGEDKALVLTLTGKAPVRPVRPRPPVKKDEPHA